MTLHDQDSACPTVVFTPEEGERIIKNLQRIKDWLACPAFQPNHHFAVWVAEIPLLRALCETVDTK